MEALAGDEKPVTGSAKVLERLDSGAVPNLSFGVSSGDPSSLSLLSTSRKKSFFEFATLLACLTAPPGTVLPTSSNDRLRVDIMLDHLL